MNRARIVLFVVVALAGVAWLLWPGPSDEDRVRAVIDAVVEGAEDGDVGDVMDHVSARFGGREGGDGLDASMLQALLARQFLTRGPLHVVVATTEVRVAGDTAHAAIDATLTESDTRLGIVPVNGDAWHLEVDFAREEGDEWRVIGATRESLVR